MSDRMMRKSNTTQGLNILGVTLDRTLSFKQHCNNVAANVQTRNTLLSNIANSTWSASTHVMRTTALATWYSVAELACPMWLDSAHSKTVNIAFKETCRKATSCIQPTPINAHWYRPTFHQAAKPKPSCRGEILTRIRSQTSVVRSPAE